MGMAKITVWYEVENKADFDDVVEKLNDDDKVVEFEIKKVLGVY